ncbi:MAG: SBBP repeat-containing protein, partial [Acidobacteriota bacterium]|nr:SBBP repeat-containing protein [Acidobacteriota bacterium]
MICQREHRIGRLILLLGVAVILGILSMPSPRAGAAVQAVDRSDAGTSGTILPFTSWGHALGFGESRLFIASGDHMLRVELVGGRRVAPVADKTATESGVIEPKDPRGSGTAKTTAMETPASVSNSPQRPSIAQKGMSNHVAGAAEGAQTPAFERVAYPDVWAGVTVAYEKSERGIYESSYMIAAGTSGRPVENIHLRYNRPVRIDTNGDLVIAYERGEMRESAPVAWQEREGMKIPVDVAFKSFSGHEIGFAVGGYDRALPLMIDPILTWNTFLGGSGWDFGYGIAVDASGNVYLVGRSTATWGSPIRAYTSGNDIYAAKLDSGGNLTWNTFLGGSGSDVGNGIAVDGSNNVYVGGSSDATWGSPKRAFVSNDDAFAAKLDSGGNLTWNTFLGGSSSDFGLGVAVDGSNNVYVGGYSNATWGSPIRAYTSNSDAFAAKLDSGGNLTWNTFLGGDDADFGRGIAVDGSSYVYVGGYSNASWGSPIRAYTSGYDAFAVKLDSGGNLTWNTFLGGSGGDYGNCIAVNG